MYSYELYIQNTKKHTALKLRWQLRFLGVRKIMKHPKLSGLLKIYQNLSNHKVYDKEGHKQKTYLKRNMFFNTLLAWWNIACSPQFLDHPPSAGKSEDFIVFCSMHCRDNFPTVGCKSCKML